VVIIKNRIKNCELLWSNQAGRGIIVRFCPEGSNPKTLIGVYVLNGRTEQQSFYNDLMPVYRAYKPDIIMGDFNTVEAPNDRNPARPKVPRVHAALRDFLHANNQMVDGWRATFGDKRKFTF